MSYNKYELEMLERYEKMSEELSGWNDEPPIKTASKESVLRYARCADPFNPLYNDEGYAKASALGGLTAVPLYQDRVDAFSYFPTIDPRGGLIEHVLYGGDWSALRPVRVGDEFRVLHHKPQMTDITSPETYGGVRTFGFLQKDSEVYNQRGELISRHLHYFDFCVRTAPQNLPTFTPDIKDHAYTPEQLEYIDGVIRGEKIRGSEKRYWEDVKLGDSIGETTLGPTTVWDMIAYAMGREELPCYPMRWIRRSGDVNGSLYTDADTGVSHLAAEWHYTPTNMFTKNYRGFHPCDFARTQMCRAATNWMGDDGWLTAFNFRHLHRTPIGDTQVTRGYVCDKYVNEKGEHIAVLDIWLDDLCRGHVTECSKAYVILPSRESHAPTKRAEPISPAFAKGQRVRLKDRPEWWPGGYRYAGATGTVTEIYPWREVFKEFPEYIAVRIDPESTPAPIDILPELTFRGDFLELI